VYSVQFFFLLKNQKKNVGSSAVLSELFDTERLSELRDFRIARVTAKGEAIEQFAACMHLVLDLAYKYPRDSVAAYILDCAVSPCIAVPMYSPWQSKADHLQC
jgi:hypothetical protein